MTFRVMTPVPEKQQSQATVHSSPNFSQYGHSPTMPPPAYTTDDLLAAKYQKISKWTQLARVILAFLAFCLSAAVIGCSADSLQGFSTSQMQSQLMLPLWPLVVDLRPTRAVLACGIIMMVFSLVYLVLALIPMQNKLHNLNLASTIINFLSLFLTLFTILFASTITSNLSGAPNTGSLLSWTCRWQGFEEMAPASFTKICNEGSAALDMVVALAVLSVSSVVATGLGWWVEMKLRRGGLEGETKSQIELVHQAA